MTIKIVNGKRYVTLQTYLNNKRIPKIQKDFINIQVEMVIRTAKKILNLSKNPETFDAFRYQGGLITCIKDLYKLNETIISGNYHLGFSIMKVNEIHNLIVAMEDLLEHTNELIQSLRAQGNYDGTYNILQEQGA